MATHEMLRLPDTRVERILQQDTRIGLEMPECFVFIELAGSQEQTKWRQAGVLWIEEPEIEGALPDCPCTVQTGDILDNGFVYRDMPELPIDSRGSVGCMLKFRDRDEPLIINGSRIRMEFTDERRYVAHLRPD